jgi:hypothetical protein
MTAVKTPSQPVSKQAELRGDEKDVRSESGDVRADREDSDRPISEDPELSDSVRLEMLRGGGQAILPDIPQIDGYHVCWLSTTNGSDPIHRRMQLGYSPIKASDIPGFAHAGLKSGEFQGCVSVNEMIAFKIPLRLYNEYMKEMHYRAPNREEEAVNSIYDDAIAQAARINDRAQTLLTEEGRVRQNMNIPEPNFV